MNPCLAHGRDISLSAQLDENEHDEMDALATALPRLSKQSITDIFEEDEEAFRRIYRRYTDHVGSAGFEFGRCDELASVGRRVTTATRDPGLLRMTVTSLANLGRNHNRWYVRDVLTEILQGIRRPDSALAASEGLEEADVSAVDWSLTEFSIKSLHPILRARIEQILEEEDDNGDPRGDGPCTTHVDINYGRFRSRRWVVGHVRYANGQPRSRPRPSSQIVERSAESVERGRAVPACVL
jgi:hypothetical protein